MNLRFANRELDGRRKMFEISASSCIFESIYVYCLYIKQIEIMENNIICIDLFEAAEVTIIVGFFLLGFFFEDIVRIIRKIKKY
jgi:hypothetical protein